MNSPDINVEDFQSAVDFLSNLENVDTEDFKVGEYKLGGGVIDPLPEDATQFVKDYYAYYKTPRDFFQ